VAGSYRERKRLRVTQRYKESQKKWKILKGTIIRKSTDPIEIGRRARSFFSRQSQKFEQVYYLEKLTKYPSNMLIHYDKAPTERGFSLEHLMGERKTYLLDWNTPRSPDVSPNDLIFFSKLKLTLNERRF
jgi:hypothetical protein